MPQKTTRPKGRPAKPSPAIPDTFENVLKALVATAKPKDKSA